jgi:hypothetical protein
MGSADIGTTAQLSCAVARDVAIDTAAVGGVEEAAVDPEELEPHAVAASAPASTAPAATGRA